MKNNYCFSKFVAALSGASVAIIALTLPQPGCAQNRTPPERIGVYDSRAIAVAYVGSTAQVKKMKDLTGQMKKARADGDTKAISRLETEGREWQSELNRQGFGTAPVDNLLEHIADRLPSIQAATGVSTVISKWNAAELDRHPHAVRVDVTMPLVNAFEPNETQWKRAMEIQRTKPQRIKE